MGRRVYRSYYKGHKDKIKGEGRGGGGRWDWVEWKKHINEQSSKPILFCISVLLVFLVLVIFSFHQNIQLKLLIKNKIQIFYFQKKDLTHYYIIITLLIKT